MIIDGSNLNHRRKRGQSRTQMGGYEGAEGENMKDKDGRTSRGICPRLLRVLYPALSKLVIVREGI